MVFFSSPGLELRMYINGCCGEKDADNWLSACPEHRTSFSAIELSPKFLPHAVFADVLCEHFDQLLYIILDVMLSPLLRPYCSLLCHLPSSWDIEWIQPERQFGEEISPSENHKTTSNVTNNGVIHRKHKNWNLNTENFFFFGSDHEIKQRRSFLGKLVTWVFKREMVVSRDNEQCGATEILIVDQMFETKRISFQDMF